jgi:hypothetical protein
MNLSEDPNKLAACCMKNDSWAGIIVECDFQSASV